MTLGKNLDILDKAVFDQGRSRVLVWILDRKVVYCWAMSIENRATYKVTSAPSFTVNRRRFLQAVAASVGSSVVAACGSVESPRVEETPKPAARVGLSPTAGVTPEVQASRERLVLRSTTEMYETEIGRSDAAKFSDIFYSSINHGFDIEAEQFILRLQFLPEEQLRKHLSKNRHVSRDEDGSGTRTSDMTVYTLRIPMTDLGLAATVSLSFNTNLNSRPFHESLSFAFSTREGKLPRYSQEEMRERAGRIFRFFSQSQIWTPTQLNGIDGLEFKSSYTRESLSINERGGWQRQLDKK